MFFRREHLQALAKMKLPRDYLAKFTGIIFVLGCLCFPYFKSLLWRLRDFFYFINNMEVARLEF